MPLEVVVVTGKLLTAAREHAAQLIATVVLVLPRDLIALRCRNQVPVVVMGVDRRHAAGRIVAELGQPV